MKRPELGKRLLPLLDIILILLAFFIILPHGIVTSEKLELSSFKKKNTKLNNQLNYYKWKYGKQKTSVQKLYKTMELTISSNQLYTNSKLIKDEMWFETLERKILSQDINFVIIKIFDIAGKPTRAGTVKKLENVLDKLNVIHIIELK